MLLPFVFLSVSLFFLANRTGIFSEPEYADINVPYGEQIRVILQDGSIVHLNSDSRLRYPSSLDCSIVRWSFGEKGISMLPKMRTALLRWICKGGSESNWNKIQCKGIFRRTQYLDNLG